MGWTYDANSPKRDTSVPIANEIAVAFAPQSIPWRYKFVRLWRFLTRR